MQRVMKRKKEQKTNYIKDIWRGVDNGYKITTERKTQLVGPMHHHIAFTHARTHTHTQPFNGPFSGTTRVSRYRKGKTNLDFTEGRDSEWQWHQLGHIQVCTSPQRDNHASTPPLKFFTGRMAFLTPNQQRQSTEGKSTEGIHSKIAVIQAVKREPQLTALQLPEGDVFRVHPLGWLQRYVELWAIGVAALVGHSHNASAVMWYNKVLVCNAPPVPANQQRLWIINYTE